MDYLVGILLILQLITCAITGILLYVYYKTDSRIINFYGGLFCGISLGLNISTWIIKIIC